MKVPLWADELVSRGLPELRAKGEGQELEFKREFPQQVTDLAKEIAAFATSNSGTILIGVDDEGDIAGLKEVESPAERDKLLQRLEGICTNSIRPAVTPKATWAVESERVVLVVTVPKGSEPVYYSQQKPYLRHISTSRPAEPHEVVELVRKHLATRGEKVETTQTSEEKFRSDLASLLTRALAWAALPSNDRLTNPNLEKWRADCGFVATSLRTLASTDVAANEGLRPRLTLTADAFDEVVNFRLALNNGQDLEELAKRASSLADGLKQDIIDNIPPSEAFCAEALHAVRQFSRDVSDLGRRAYRMTQDGKIEQIKTEIGEIGEELVRLSFYDLSAIGKWFSPTLRKIGLRMRQVEMLRIYLDGGASSKQVQNDVIDCARALAALIEDQRGDPPSPLSPSADDIVTPEGLVFSKDEYERTRR
ncbi:hypothetical protein A6V36_20565 [Paraburkholderia ginsengiterrae]|uniref:Schlafen AlbA-2 domain-containing protein n=1 Tax=Paraburkholderia ginsengiterrae TaxID=1462993 RepID=A0A1A9NE65_9BURK|nr:ATP-binding protein [Paraburkholderia ginsengiterrae]OAJ62767.1 hypothetical protein A6V36_20565 [Paraburkholderia ginsengiterrae]OAJ64428.1 hypothetical protein A6V37_19590 [Paraburkholderia ginsengiterrae]